MKLRNWLTSGSIAALAMAAVIAAAQEGTPPADPQDKKQDETEETVIPVKYNKLTVGYTGAKSSAWLSRYARPSEGLSLHELNLFTPGGETWPYARLIVRGMPDQDNYLDGYVVLNHGHTVVRGTREQHSFFDHDWRSVDESEDNHTEITIDHSFTPKIGAFAQYSTNERDARYAAPKDPEHNRTKTFAGGVQGDVLGGNLAVTVTDRRTFDDTGAQPTTLQRRFDASYARDIGSAISLEGSAGYTLIEQAGLNSSKVRSYALAGALDLGPMTGLQFNMGRVDYDMDNVRNAYARKRLTTGIRLLHRWPGWNFQFGYRHRETERVRTDQTFVDVPKWNDYDARLSGRIGQARITLKGSWEDLREDATMNTFDPRRLQWDDRAMFQAKVDGGNDVFNAYGVYTYRFQQNVLRGIEINWNNFVLGGSVVFNEALNAYGEVSYDSYKAIGGADSQNLDFFFPDSRSISAGLNWAKDENLSASASLNYYESGDVRGTQLTLSLKRRFGNDHDLELVVAPWRHDDRLYDLTNYRTTFLMVKYTVRF